LQERVVWGFGFAFFDGGGLMASAEVADVLKFSLHSKSVAVPSDDASRSNPPCILTLFRWNEWGGQKQNEEAEAEN